MNRRQGISYLPILVMGLVLSGCGFRTGETEESVRTDTAGADAAGASTARSSKMMFPVSARLVLEGHPEPGAPADLTLHLESSLPEDATVEVDLRLPRGLALEKGKAKSHRRLGARAKASVPYRFRMPERGRFVVEALVHLPNPEGLPATGGTTLVIDPGGDGPPEKETVHVQSADGRTLNVTVTE